MVLYEGAIIDRPETVEGGCRKAGSISPVFHTASEVAITLSQFNLRKRLQVRPSGTGDCVIRIKTRAKLRSRHSHVRFNKAWMRGVVEGMNEGRTRSKVQLTPRMSFRASDRSIAGVTSSG